MNAASGPLLAAAVTNAGGIGVIGGLRQTPKILQETIDELKANLEDKNAPFGVDLLIPKVGAGARKTNVGTPPNFQSSKHNALLSQYDYLKGKLPEIVDIIIKNKAALFVCAVGVPPKEVVDKLHAAGIPVMKFVH